MGRTSRSRWMPMFFIARTVAAMFTGSCGSWSTTHTVSRSVSGMRDDEGMETRLPVAAEIDEPALRAAEHELPAPPLTFGRHVVDDDLHLERFALEQRGSDRQRALDEISVRRGPPGGLQRRG